MSQVSVRQAAFLTGKSRETINNATKEGTLSFTHNSRNHKVIDVAELTRVYPLVKTMEDLKDESESVRPDTASPVKPSGVESAVLQERVERLQAEKELLEKERERERGHFEATIDDLRTNLEKAQENHGKAMLLLTDQRQGSGSRGLEHDEKIKALEQQVKKMRIRTHRVHKALEAEKNKTLWQRLFGGGGASAPTTEAKL